MFNNKYSQAVAAFNTAKAKLYNSKLTQSEYTKAVIASDAAYAALLTEANEQNG